MIKKSFEYLDLGMLSKLFTTLVQPILKYGNAIWGSLFTLDQRKVEKVQRRATHLLPSLHDKSILRGYQYYPYHHCCIDARGVI